MLQERLPGTSKVENRENSLLCALCYAVAEALINPKPIKPKPNLLYATTLNQLMRDLGHIVSSQKLLSLDLMLSKSSKSNSRIRYTQYTYCVCVDTIHVHTRGRFVVFPEVDDFVVKYATRKHAVFNHAVD